MDYTNFVRTYYAFALSKLKNFKHYSGDFVNINEKWNIPDNFLHEVKSENDFLPSEEVVINAPTQYLEEYLEYLGKLMPDLEEILASKSRIHFLYQNFLNRNGENDEQWIGQIGTYLDFGIEVKKEMGVLA